MKDTRRHPVGLTKHYLHVLCVCAALTIALVSATRVQAAPLAPGGFILAPSEPDPVGGTVLFSTNASFSSASFSGTLTSSVLTNDTSSPFSGGLTFTYQITVISGPDAVSGLSVSRFGSYFTDVSYQPAALVPPSAIDRSNEGGGSGNVVRFHFFGGGLTPGNTSTLLVVQTDAPQWQFTTASLIDGVASPNVISLAPLAVPEPQIALFGLAGLAGWLVTRRGRKS